MCRGFDMFKLYERLDAEISCSVITNRLSQFTGLDSAFRY
jgi:hypothetical protein